LSEPDRLKTDFSGSIADLVDGYLTGRIEAAGLSELEAKLLADEGARREFLRYCQMQADIGFAVRASVAGRRALQTIQAPAAQAPAARRSLLDVGAVAGKAPGILSEGLDARPLRRKLRLIAAMALACLLAAGAWGMASRWWGDRGSPAGGDRPGVTAWLVNAQDCQWEEAMAPTGDMRAGGLLRIKRGLAEVGFRCGARMVLEGPASLEILSGTSARILCGRATVKVPENARGFTVLSPRGRVVDLGTEFGISVAEDGITEVFVFKGLVEAASGGDRDRNPAAVRIGERQAAVLRREGISFLRESEAAASLQFVRKIVPPWSIVPRALRIEFRGAVDGTLRDDRGAGTGFTHRLPGTGSSLNELDANLQLRAAEGKLELRTTASDINTQFRLDQGEYLGMRLSELGFSGTEDFAVAVSIPDIPPMDFVGQFGLFAGSRSDRVIRGGLISLRKPEAYSLFLVNNDGGLDSDLHTVGLLSTGDDLMLTLRRAGGKYSLTVENRTTGRSSALAIRHPGYLDGESDLVVGLFAANPRGEMRRTVLIDEFEATVWTVPQ